MMRLLAVVLLAAIALAVLTVWGPQDGINGGVLIPWLILCAIVLGIAAEIDRRSRHNDREDPDR